MTNLNLLRGLEDANDPGAPAGKRRKRAPRTPESGSPAVLLVVLLVLLLGGGLAVYFAKPEWLGLPAGARSTGAARLQAEEAARQTLWRGASRQIDASQAQASAWFEWLRTTLPDPHETEYAFTLVAFTPPGEFVLRGTAGSMDAASVIQEALALLPGMNLRQSRARPSDAPRRGYDILFTGALEAPTADTAAPRMRVLPAAELDGALRRLVETAAASGVALTTPDTAMETTSGTLRLLSWRLAGVADSAGIPALARVLETERMRGSPLGVRRVMLETRDGLQAVFLDIMAYAR